MLFSRLPKNPTMIRSQLPLHSICCSSIQPLSHHLMFPYCPSRVTTIFRATHSNPSPLPSKTPSTTTLSPSKKFPVRTTFKGEETRREEDQTSPETEITTSRAVLRSLRLYGDLGKANLSLLVAISSLAVWFAAGPPFALGIPACLFAGTFLLSSSAASMNHIIERDYDALMKRTRMRPLPSGRMTVLQAKVFAAASMASGAAILYVGTNPLTVSIGVGTLLSYAFIYTPLKRVHWVNTEVATIMYCKCMFFVCLIDCSIVRLFIVVLFVSYVYLYLIIHVIIFIYFLLLIDFNFVLFDFY
jgi:hypothetical protein